MAEHECECPEGVPDWVVTFGDMMSLLLTFFILLVSMSEMRNERRVTAMMQAMREQFGYDASAAASIPGHHPAMSQKMADLANLGRSKRKNLEEGGSNSVRAPVGAHARVRSIRTTGMDRKGGAVLFDGSSPQLDDTAREQLATVAEQVRGLPQVVEVRGHAATVDQRGTDSWDLAYRRAKAVMEQLVDLGVDRRRFRLEVAGPNEPAHISNDPEKLKENSRVEVYLRQQLADEARGTEQERAGRNTAGFQQDAS
ncbi:MAG: OmpA family protein [Planctomycetales bacterium]|nr:OmpA family protein [Planctomycetales bacterium]